MFAMTPEGLKKKRIPATNMKTLLFDRLGRLLSFTILHVMIGMIGHIQSSALLDVR
jgi:hypothetical protein